MKISRNATAEVALKELSMTNREPKEWLTINLMDAFSGKATEPGFTIVVSDYGTKGFIKLTFMNARLFMSFCRASTDAQYHFAGSVSQLLCAEQLDMVIVPIPWSASTTRNVQVSLMKDSYSHLRLVLAH